MPEKVDQFLHPQVSGETAMIDHQVAKKLLLDFGPFAGEPAVMFLEESIGGVSHSSKN
jgi:hypothetical protein